MYTIGIAIRAPRSAGSSLEPEFRWTLRVIGSNRFGTFPNGPNAEREPAELLTP
jgi:hypothetical protein